MTKSGRRFVPCFTDSFNSTTLTIVKALSEARKNILQKIETHRIINEAISKFISLARKIAYYKYLNFMYGITSCPAAGNQKRCIDDCFVPVCRF